MRQDKPIAPEPERFRSAAYREVIASAPWPGKALVRARAFEAMKLELVRAYPEEGCGLLLGEIRGDDFFIHAVHAARNANAERMQDRFLIAPEDYRSAEEAAQQHGWEIVGVYHSHPDCPARPSPTDRSFAWHGWLYPIAAIVEGRFAELCGWVFDEEMGKFRACEVVVAS